jgi:rod shape-determining protein MreC
MANGTWKIARGRSSGHWALAVFAVLALFVLLLGRAQPALFDRAHAYFTDWSAPVLEAARVPLKVLVRWAGGLGDTFTVYEDNIRLKAENARLRQWQNAALVLEQRLKRYQLLLHAVPDPAVAGVTARVIGRDSRPFLNTVILDAGARQGVKPGEAVVDPRGMIGRILVAGHHTSWVILLTDLNSRIPVTIEPGNIQAILAGDNTSSPTLEVSATEVRLKQGEPIVTSGDGGLLPAGLPIGMVWLDGQIFRAALLADASTSDDVRILDLKLPTERMPPLSAKDLPVAAAGLPPLAPPPPKSASESASPAQPAPVANRTGGSQPGSAPAGNSSASGQSAVNIAPHVAPRPRPTATPMIRHSTAVNATPPAAPQPRPAAAAAPPPATATADAPGDQADEQDQ